MIHYHLIRIFSKSLNLIHTKIKYLLNLKYASARVEIHSSSKLKLSKVSLKSGCKLFVDQDSQIDGSISFDKEDALIKIGRRVFMNGSLISAKSIEIGDDVMISWGVTIVDHNSHSISFSNRAQDVLDWRVGKKDWSNVKIASVKISSKVWIGFNVVILKGVLVGEGAIIGAGSVVTKDIPSWTIVAGNPARVIREIPEDER